MPSRWCACGKPVTSVIARTVAYHDATRYVEILQELIPRQGGPAEIRLQYANTRRAQANLFTNRTDHVLTFRLDGSLRPVRFRLHVSYDATANRWHVEPYSAVSPIA
jgi:hypothetical protein